MSKAIIISFTEVNLEAINIDFHDPQLDSKAILLELGFTPTVKTATTVELFIHIRYYIVEDEKNISILHADFISDLLFNNEQLDFQKEAFIAKEDFAPALQRIIELTKGYLMAKNPSKVLSNSYLKYIDGNELIQDSDFFIPHKKLIQLQKEVD